MFLKTISAAIFACFISVNSWADNVSQIFGDGLFETNWGQSVRAVTRG